LWHFSSCPPHEGIVAKTVSIAGIRWLTLAPNKQTIAEVLLACWFRSNSEERNVRRRHLADRDFACDVVHLVVNEPSNPSAQLPGRRNWIPADSTIFAIPFLTASSNEEEV